MKRKKLIMKKRALSWILALALSGSSLALPVSAAEPDDNVQVETYDETSDFENDADIEITDEGQDADGGASEDINVTEDGNAEDFRCHYHSVLCCNPCGDDGNRASAACSKHSDDFQKPHDL